MRQILHSLIFVILTGIFSVLSGQTIEIPENGRIHIKEKSGPTAYYPSFRLTDRDPGIDYNIQIAYPATAQTTAISNLDYRLINNPPQVAILAGDAGHFTLGFEVLPRNIFRDSVVFEIAFSYQNRQGPQLQRATVVILSANPATTAQPDTAKWSVKLLTGSNFDFFDAPVFKNFAGDLHVWLPDIGSLKVGRDKKWSWGLNIGFFTYRYYEADSSGKKVQMDRYFLNPNERIVDIGTKYIESTYTVDSKTSFNTVGAYLNPMVRLSKPSNKWLDIFASLHIEGLWRTEILTYTQKSVRIDTFTIQPSDIRGILIQSYPGLRPRYEKQSYNDTYIGFGMPIKVNIKNIFELYLAPTAGLVAYEYTDVVTDVRDKVIYRTFTPASAINGFILTKAKLSSTAGPLGLSIGGEFRRIFGQKTFYAVYAGVALPVDKWLK